MSENNNGGFFGSIGRFFRGAGRVIGNTIKNISNDLSLLPMKSDIERSLNKFKTTVIKSAFKLKEGLTNKALQAGGIEEKAKKEAELKKNPTKLIQQEKKRMKNKNITRSKDDATMWSGPSMKKGERDINKVANKVKPPLVKDVSSTISKAAEVAKSAPVKAAPIKNIDIGKER